MGHKVAIATFDGKNIDEHFGRANAFHVYEFDRNGWKFVENRLVSAACNNGGHSEFGLEQAAQTLADCKTVLALAIGPGAVMALARVGIRAFAVQDSIEGALEKLVSRERRAFAI